MPIIDDEDPNPYAKPYPYAKPAYTPVYKHTSLHPVPQGGDCVIWNDEEKCKIIVRAPFHADFVSLCRHLQGRNFVKKEEEVGGVKKTLDKYWEFDLGPENIKELLRILKLCYQKISMPPVELLWMWELLEPEDVEAVYKIILGRCKDDDKIRAKVEKFFKRHIDIGKILVRAGRRIELGDE